MVSLLFHRGVEARARFLRLLLIGLIAGAFLCPVALAQVCTVPSASFPPSGTDNGTCSSGSVLASGSSCLLAAQPGYSVKIKPYPDALHAGELLSSGECLVAFNNIAKACMQGDGNFVLVGNGGVLWHSGTAGNPGTQTARWMRLEIQQENKHPTLSDFFSRCLSFFLSFSFFQAPA
jgi:hypothetical protein